MSLQRLKLGKIGENLASQSLLDTGYTIITRNYRTRYGEIDIICTHSNILVFIEVKTRKSRFLDSPFAAVTEQKQRQISKVAQHYLSKNKLFDQEARFDVIAITIGDDNTHRIEHLENAFDLRYGF